MTNGLKETQVKILTYLVYILITILTGATIVLAIDYQAFKSNLPDSYVRLERYQSDKETNQCTLDRIENKIDTLNKHLLRERQND